MSESKTYSGWLALHGYGEADDILFLSTLREPLAEELEWIAYKEVSVRYWITDKEATKDEAQESFVRKLFGEAEVKFGARYSEITGYLWTDEDLNVGGHDLLAELRGHVGKWLILEVEVA